MDTAGSQPNVASTLLRNIGVQIDFTLISMAIRGGEYFDGFPISANEVRAIAESRLALNLEDQLALALVLCEDNDTSEISEVLSRAGYDPQIAPQPGAEAVWIAALLQERIPDDVEAWAREGEPMMTVVDLVSFWSQYQIQLGDSVDYADYSTGRYEEVIARSRQWISQVVKSYLSR